MTKFLIGVLTGIMLTGLLAVIVIFALVRTGEKRPTVAEGSTLILRIEGPVPEQAPVEFPIPFLEQQTPLTVADYWDLLRKAAVDSRIKAVVVEPRGVGAGWAKLQEIRNCLVEFRKSGKPLFVYLKAPGTREYYLATAADRIYIAPEEWLNVKGVRAELMYFRKTLDKIGVQAEIVHAGKYKDFGDTFTRTNMSEETREVMNSVLDEVYLHLVETLAKGRKKSAEQIRSAIDQGPFLAEQALRLGLVDGLIYEDQMFDELKKRLNAKEIKKLSCRDYVKVPSSGLDLEGKQRIALLIGEGDILRGGGGDGMGADGEIYSDGFSKLLRQVGNDRLIRGVVVRINSPGGDSVASDEIWREMNLLSKKKPVVISMSDAAASGGYYISMTGDPVLAYPGTFTGSVGVVFGKINLRGLYDKLGITKDLLVRGKFADIDSDYRSLTDEERRKLREGIDDNYKTFVTRVAEGRKRKFEEIEPLAQGRVWLGSQAMQRGLVDELGGLDRAIELVKQKARIPRSEKVRLLTYPPRRNILDLIFSRATEGLAESRARQVLEKLHVKVWSPGGMLRLMPFTVEIQ